jgi:hypothetical protein
MRFYKLSAEERAKIEAFNATQKNTLLIICDHGEGNVGIDADAVESPAFKDYFAELGNLLEPSRLVNIDLVALRATVISKSQEK